MKILLILFVILCLNNSIAIAQNISGGFKAGVVGSQVSGDRLSGFNKAGLFGGVFAGVPISNDISIQIEMMYIQKGSRKNPKPDRGDYSSYILRLNYIELPLSLVYTGNDYFEVESGLSYGILIKNTDVERDENGIMPGQSPFRPFEISGNIGLNYKLNENLKVNFRFNNSLLHVREHQGGGKYWFNTGQFNSVVMLGVTYQPGGRN
jgi:hypothetical protein